MITLFLSDTLQNPTVSYFPIKVEIKTIDDFRYSVYSDYVCAAYRNNHRSNEDFLWANGLGMDCDNDHSNNPEDWKTPDDIRRAFPNVMCLIHYSRHHQKQKKDKGPRPRFHVLFPISVCDNVETYAALKRKAYEMFPFFDNNALDAARMFFGTEESCVEYIDGELGLDEYIKQHESNKTATTKNAGASSIILEGERNSMLSHFAGKVLIKYGDTDKAYQCFVEESKKCEPPLDSLELATIWTSARKFSQSIRDKEEYVQPEEYQTDAGTGIAQSYKPDDQSDVGQAEMLAHCYRDHLRYSTQTGYIYYNGQYWEESELRAQALAQELTDCQMDEYLENLQQAETEFVESGAKKLVEKMGTRAEGALNERQKESVQALQDARGYGKYIASRRKSTNIRATLTEAKPMLEIDPQLLDSDPYLLCTPGGTYDLREGTLSLRPHSPEDYITKITAVSAGYAGEELWNAHLKSVFCGDQELIDYVQLLCGTILMGQVKMEGIIMAYGGGRNGKSTLWNVIARVLGNYSGTLSAETLTTSCKHNNRPELAELRGKRLVIAAEMREGAILDDGVVKVLSSTDLIHAEKKYKAPFAFTPSHSTVLYTNHLPKVRATDDGIWRRLHVVPFDARFTGKSDIKNYADFLFQNAGEYILLWMIEGAQKAYVLGYSFERPKRVRDAIDAYRAANDWFGNFISEKCIVHPEARVESGKLYSAYRNYCMETNEYTRSTKDFYAAVEAAGYQRTTSKGCSFRLGIQLRD